MAETLSDRGSVAMDYAETGLQAVMNLLHRRWRVIAATFSAVFGFAAISLFVVPSIYSATALVAVDMGNAARLNPGRTTGWEGAVVDSEVEVLRSDAVLLGAIEDLGLVSDPEFGPRPAFVERIFSLAGLLSIPRLTDGEALIRTLAHIRKATTIERRGQSFVIAVSVRAAGPAQAARLANAIAARYLAQQSPAGPARSQIVSFAQPSAYPVAPDRPVGLVLAALGGLGLGLCLALVRDRLIGGFTSSEQLSGLTGKPALGTVPLARIPPDIPSVSQLMVLFPLSDYAEAIRGLRAGIDRHMHKSGALPRTGRGAVVMVTSPLAGEGRTSIALSLARDYALSGRKTLVIDGDLRNPGIHRHLGIEPDFGLLEYLSGARPGRSPASLIILDSETGMSVVIGSRRSEIPTGQLIAGPAFHRLITAAADNFDVVILDTPAILPLVDGLYLAQYADAFLMVVKSSATGQHDTRSAIARLDEHRRPGTVVLGVLNQHEALPTGRSGTFNLVQRG